MVIIIRISSPNDADISLYTNAPSDACAVPTQGYRQLGQEAGMANTSKKRTCKNLYENGAYHSCSYANYLI